MKTMENEKHAESNLISNALFCNGGKLFTFYFEKIW
jgi:hypothetical protein